MDEPVEVGSHSWDSDGGTYTTVTIFTPDPVAPPPPAYQTLYGYDCYPAELTSHAVRFPKARYMRDFGQASGGAPGQLLTPPAAARPLWAKANGVTLHYSWKKFDTTTFTMWLDVQTVPFMLSFVHEPRKKITGALYQEQDTIHADIIANHPNRDLVLAHGPVETRWSLDNVGANPLDYFIPGRHTAFFVDSYNDGYQGGSLYRPAHDMFATAAEFAYSQGVPWGVPEFGSVRVAGDESGVSRAAWITECMVETTRYRDCLCLGVYCDDAAQTNIHADPECSVYRDWLAAHA